MRIYSCSFPEPHKTCLARGTSQKGLLTSQVSNQLLRFGDIRALSQHQPPVAGSCAASQAGGTWSCRAAAALLGQHSGMAATEWRLKDCA